MGYSPALYPNITPRPGAVLPIFSRPNGYQGDAESFKVVPATDSDGEQYYLEETAHLNTFGSAADQGSMECRKMAPSPAVYLNITLHPWAVLPRFCRPDAHQGDAESLKVVPGTEKEGEE